MKIKLKKTIFVTAFGLSIAIAGLSPFNIDAAEDNSEKLVKSLIVDINEKDWDGFSKLWNSSEREYYDKYFADSLNKDGVKQINSIKLEKIYKVYSEDASPCLLVDEYPILETSKKIDTYIISVDCDVEFENNYFYNGINYFLVAVAEENGLMKISQFNRPSVQLINKYVTDSVTSYDEVAGINVLENAENGLAINADNEILEQGFETLSIRNDSLMNKNVAVALNASDSTSSWPMLGYYSNYSYPTTIRVKSYGTVNFEKYCKDVFPNEWMGSWHPQSLNAGAFCVRMVGWYHTLNPVSSTGAYDVTTRTQNYVRNSAYSTTSYIIDSTYRYIMVNSSDKIFFAEYGQGPVNERGRRGGGKLLQYGSKLLAEDGYMYNEILNYYYSGSKHSIGNVRIIKYNG